jgi:hypothetical protein
MNHDPNDSSRPASDADLAEIRNLLTSAGNVGCQRIREVAGDADFLQPLLADPQGEIIVQVALKSGAVTVAIRWPAFSSERRVVSEFVPQRDRGKAS